MDERVVQFRVGVMVLASLIITGILALLFGELPSVLRGGYVVYIKFASAPGVSQDTPVRKSGQPIGRVTKVEFAPDNEVLVTARINGNVDLYCDEAVRIKTGLLGDAEMEFVPGSKRPAKRVRVKPGDLLVGTVTGRSAASIRRPARQSHPRRKRRWAMPATKSASWQRTSTIKLNTTDFSRRHEANRRCAEVVPEVDGRRRRHHRRRKGQAET